MRKILSSSLFVLYLLTMVAATWWPFDFSFSAWSGNHIEGFQPMRITQRWWLEKDVLKFAMFIPVGIFLVIVWCPPLPSWKMLRRAFFFGVGLSVMMQVGRCFLSGRLVEVDDLLMNTAGVLLGASVIYFHHAPRRVLLLLTVSCVFCFVLAATWPCRFSWQAASRAALAQRFEWSPFQGGFSLGILRERALNGLMMLPLGLLGATYALRKDRVSRALLFTALLGFGSSLSVELLQCFLPYRTPSLSDLLLNTLGTLLGGVIAVGLERWRADQLPNK